jgi:NAD(P)-dependent dehydrogenase (short-subunit alcohol dehydrogenase family)
VTHFAGKVALITGAAHGIGRATAQLLAGEDVKIAVLDIQDELGQATVDEISAAGGDAFYLHTDIAQLDAIRESVEATEARWGRLDYVVNNAYWSARGTVEELTEEQWDRSMDVMLKAIYRYGKYAFPAMIRAGGGAMVNLGSVHSFSSAHRYSVYAAAKAAVINLTRSMAIDYGKHNIRVNAVCPGWIMTYGEPDNPEVMRRANAMYPRGRPGQPREIATAIRFLLSDDASFVNGHALVVDGGLIAQLQDSLANRVAELYT